MSTNRNTRRLVWANAVVPLAATAQRDADFALDTASRVKHVVHNIISMHLLSLPHPAASNATSEADATTLPSTEELLRNIWSWKDVQLGDGADHIVPRRQRRRRRVEWLPRSEAIRQFQDLFVGMTIRIVGNANAGLRVVLGGAQVSNEVILPVHPSCFFGAPDHDFGDLERTFTVEECSVLSTCARLNFILVMQEENSGSDAVRKRDTVSEKLAIQYAVAYSLQKQVPSPSPCTRDDQSGMIQRIAGELAPIEGAESIMSHLCLVASGLSARPDKPGSGVIFRPHSSHDAHILMQLKRAVEIISVRNDGRKHDNAATSRGSRQGNSRRQHRRSSVSPAKMQQLRKKRMAAPGSTSRGRIKILLDGALRAGKMARNEAVVPIAPLQQYSSDESVPPDELMIPAIEAVKERAIAPAISSCVARLEAMQNGSSAQISLLRQRIHNFVDELSSECANEGSSSQLKQLANRLLHEPTMRIRQQMLFEDEMEAIIAEIERQLLTADKY